MCFLWHLCSERKCISQVVLNRSPGRGTCCSALPGAGRAGQGPGDPGWLTCPGGWRICLSTPPHPFVKKAFQMLLGVLVLAMGGRTLRGPQGADLWSRPDQTGRGDVRGKLQCRPLGAWHPDNCWPPGAGWERPVPVTLFQFS